MQRFVSTILLTAMMLYLGGCGSEGHVTSKIADRPEVDPSPPSDELKDYNYSGRAATSEDALTATISSNASKSPKEPGEIVVTFTLKNNAALPVRIWKRWCSWGWFAWNFTVNTGDGRAYLLMGAPRAWTVNYPDPIDIQPGKSATYKFSIFRVLNDRSDDWTWRLRDKDGQIGGSVLAADLPFDQKLTVQGHFSLSRDEDAERSAPFSDTYFDDPKDVAKSMKEAWRGKIDTNRISVFVAAE